jgi:hypothetical protein
MTGGLFPVYRKPMPGELRRCSSRLRGYGQRVPASRVTDFADNHDLFQLADTTELHLLMGGRKGGGKSISAKRRLAWIEKYNVFRHQGEQADKIATVDGINPD